MIIRIAKGGRVTVPGWMREMCGLKPGRRVLCIANRDGGLRLRAVPGRSGRRWTVDSGREFPGRKAED